MRESRCWWTSPSAGRRNTRLAQYRAQLERRVEERTVELSQANQKLRAEVEERHRIEGDLRAAKAAAEAANTAKSSFLANTSHEIRTPLTSILGYADLLADPALPEDRRDQYLEVLQQNAQHLLALIDDLLDLSRAEMGKVRLTFADHSPRGIAEEAVDLLRAWASEKALELTLECAAGLPQAVFTDGVRVRQILLNLLSNVIKFTPWGRVALLVSSRSSAPGNDIIEFRVTDTGIGVAGEHLGKVFEPFYQVEQGARKRFGGSGLGLAISRQLALQLGGTLRVDSTPGQGQQPSPSNFQSKPREEMSWSTQSRRINGRSVERSCWRKIIRAYGCSLTSTCGVRGPRCLQAADGARALELVQEMMARRDGSESRIDLALLDLHMPVMDGAESMRQMRAAGFTGPIVGLTADYAEKSAAEWLRDGWDAMAAKPIDRQAFIPLLARMLDAGKQKGTPAGLPINK